jgi:hypothetical protein
MGREGRRKTDFKLERLKYYVALYSEDIPGAHMVCPSLESAVESLQSPPLTDKIESVFVLGGTRVYEVYTTVHTLEIA